MLYELMRETRNFFKVEGAERFGRFTVAGGRIDLPNLLPGQYFLVSGSVLNDGLHKNDDTDVMLDEEFSGVVSPLAIPIAFRELAQRIADWKEKAGEASPMQSESFGGYSYTRASGKNGGQLTWKDAFSGELSIWRKL